MSRVPLRSLFIASIGNPGKYRNTRHSAGHILLEAIAPLLSTHLPPVYTTWQSPSYMNESGKKLIRELESYKRNDTLSTPLTLVILHDELEKPLGKIVVKRGGPEKASLRGHNGLKDIFRWLEKKQMYPALSVLRVGVGIGRPESRSPEDVSNYVLAAMEGRELEAVKRAATFVVDTLVEEAWGSEKGIPTR
ncbi:peptidyl-tRNA hydrolase [Aspergillus karnatakaensis]|uniref:aminoacyl-tRNA hydrolase n=1 Tax=Aspergillus karnatakaensis TaxID=1810916 RepID=UPI003CCD2DDE